MLSLSKQRNIRALHVDAARTLIQKNFKED